MWVGKILFPRVDAECHGAPILFCASNNIGKKSMKLIREADETRAVF
jgi:hypothetical protein